MIKSNIGLAISIPEFNYCSNISDDSLLYSPLYTFTYTAKLSPP